MPTTKNGKFDARLVLHNVDTAAKKVLIDVEVKAHSTANEFRVADMNWRFTAVNRNAVKANSVQIETGLTLSNYTTQIIDGQPNHSFYEPHTTTGSADTLISYNVGFGGQGQLLNADTWTSVGRLSFDIEDTTETVDFVWNRRADFPPTFVGEIFEGQKFAAVEGNYEDLRVSFSDHFPVDHTNRPTGRYDVRLALNDIDTEQMKVSVDIELKADRPENLFNVSEQNYRFSISNTKAINPQSIKIEELTISGFVQTRINPTNGEVFGRTDTNSFYGKHTTTGSVAHIISYNIELQGGEGFPLEHNKWTKVGRVTFDILDLDESFKLTLHNHATFPPCFIGEKFDGTLYEAAEADYQSLLVDLSNAMASV